VGRNDHTDEPPTARQVEIHAYMLEYQAEHGAPPSLREIVDFIGASSTNAAADHLRALKRRGMVRHYPKRTRGWVPIARETKP